MSSHPSSCWSLRQGERGLEIKLREGAQRLIGRYLEVVLSNGKVVTTTTKGPKGFRSTKPSKTELAVIDDLKTRKVERLILTANGAKVIFVDRHAREEQAAQFEETIAGRCPLKDLVAA